MGFNIAIDGPAGAGKSTIAKACAKKLGFIYVDTGAMYRAIALYLLRKGVAIDDNEGFEKYCTEAKVSIEYVDGTQVVLLNGENVNGFIRTEEVGNMASASSTNKKVRAELLDLQRELAKKNWKNNAKKWNRKLKNATKDKIRPPQPRRSLFYHITNATPHSLDNFCSCSKESFVNF